MTEFKGITGPGRYRMRNGEIVSLARYQTREPCWIGDTSSEKSCLWYSAGQRIFLVPEHNIVAGPLDEPEKMAGLTGFAGVQDGRVIGFSTAEKAFDNGWSVVVDFSKVPASAIVKPEPKRETRKVWMNVYADTDELGGPYKTRRDADWQNTHRRIACIEREIKFTHGEGMS